MNPVYPHHLTLLSIECDDIPIHVNARTQHVSRRCVRARGVPAVVRHHRRASTPALASISSRTTQRDRANGTRLHEEVSSASAARGSLRRGVAREIIKFVVGTTNEFQRTISYTIKCNPPFPFPHFMHSNRETNGGIEREREKEEEIERERGSEWKRIYVEGR